MPVCRTLCLAAVLSLFAAPLFAQEDVKPGAPTFKEGDVITFDQVDKIKPFLPPEFWDNRDFFFYEGMQLEIGPSFADYGPPPVYTEATKKYSGTVNLAPGRQKRALSTRNRTICPSNSRFFPMNMDPCSASTDAEL